VPTSLERIDWVIGLDTDPVRRNLLITQAYHDLSAALSTALGRENANWCTFATWASRTAGRFIRTEEVPLPIRLLLGRLDPIEVSLARIHEVLKRADDDGIFDDDSILETVRDVVDDTGTLVAAGNLTVFAELAPLFSRTLEALASNDQPSALDELSDTLAAAPSEAGGQHLLRAALRNYANARSQPDGRRKAALMLLANGQVGLHEQIRLQPFIAASIDAPISTAVAEALNTVGASLPEPAANELRAITTRLGRPIAKGAARLWEEFATRELMTLSLPDGNLMLGRDLPAPRGQPLYPPLLDPISEPETAALLESFDAYSATATGSGAIDWAQLRDRMRYILDPFSLPPTRRDTHDSAIRYRTTPRTSAERITDSNALREPWLRLTNRPALIERRRSRRDLLWRR
jgi:hypothetical protein